MRRALLGVSVGWVGISMIADGVPALLLPHQLMASGVSDATTLGLTTLAGIGAAALIQPFAGRWSDRIGRFPVIAVGTALAVAGLGLLLAPPTAPVGCVVTLSGVSIAQAGHQALLPDRIGRAWRGRGGGLKSAFDVAGAFAGFLVLAALLGAGEAGLGTAVLGLALVVSFGLGLVLLSRAEPAPTAAADLPAVGPGRSFAMLILARFMFLLGIYVVGRFLLVFVAQRLGLGADEAGSEAGIALAVLALITVAASFPSGWLADRLGRRPLMLAGGAIGAIGIGLMPVATSIEAVLAFGTLMAVGSAAFGSASWAMLADLSASARSGRLLGLANAGTAGAAAMAGALGIVVDAAGFGATFSIAAACTLAGGVLALQLAEVRLRAATPFTASAEGAR